MTAQDRFERAVASWLRDDAMPASPDQLEALLVRTSAIRQRRWWSSPERWLPMDTTLRPRLFNVPRPSQVLLVAALVLALLGVALLYAGTHEPRLPAPFGPAKNGVLTFGAGGDVYTLTSIDATPVALVKGATVDALPSFSRDGSRLWFVRDLRASGGGFSLMVGRADGSDIRPLLELGDLPEYADQSPDGSMFAFAGTYQGAHGIYVMKTDGSDQPHWLDLGSDAAGWPMWRPPDGHEIVFLVHESSDLRLYAVKPDGTASRLIRDLGDLDDASMSQFGPSLSPDGRYLVYAKADAVGFRHHLVDLDAGTDRQLTLGPGTGHELNGQFSPDGTKLLFHFADGTTDLIQEMLAPIDVSAFAVKIGPPYPIINGSADLNQAFSPDGRTIMIFEGRDKQIRAVNADIPDLGMVMSWQPDDLPAWQRLAP